ncbi:MAG: methyltransferase domain-containing protein [Myxococcales bacterium]|nr:methyltransferase domain-containing protein [Myxococcales bacterium]
MSTRGVTDSTILRAFDREAGGYAERWDVSPLVQFWRGRVLARVLAAVPFGARVADLGCGIGTDARLLVAGGYRVMALDGSGEMVARARARGVPALVAPLAEAPSALGGGYDAVVCNFGVLNCLGSLAPLSAAVGGLLGPGGHIFLVWMSRHCPADSLARVRRGLRPRRGRRQATVAGVQVELTWWSVAEVVAALGRSVRVRRVEAVGLLDPPPDLGGRLGWRSAAEVRVASLPGLRHLGDHTLVHAVRS